MTTYNFAISFQGLCGFVPHESGKSLQVVLIDGRAGSAFLGAPPAGVNVIPAHLPHAIFERQAGDLPYQYPEFDVYQRGAVRVLSRQELRIDGDGILEKELDLNALSLVPDFERATGVNGAGTINPACVTRQAAPSKLIVARLIADRGKLFTSPFEKDWDFVRLEGSAVGNSSGRMAQSVELRLTSTKPTLTISAHPLDGDDGPDWTLEVPGSPNDGKFGRVRIRNHPLAAMFPVGANPAEHASYVTGDTHFEWFYELLDKPPAVRERPLPRFKPASSDPWSAGEPLPGGSNPDCPRVRYKPTRF